MPTLILDNLPADVFERLRKLAAANNQTVAAEAVQQLRLLLPDPPFLAEEISAPCDLSRPGLGLPVAVHPGEVRLPDPPFLPEEISAPCDLPLPGEKVRVQARNGHLPPPDPPIFAEERW